MQNKSVFKLCIAIFVAIFLTTAVFANANIRQEREPIGESTTEKLSYSLYFSEPKLDEYAIKENTFTSIYVSDCVSVSKNPGDPALPVSGVSILVPMGAEITNINVFGEKFEFETRDINLEEKPVFPYQRSIPIGQKSDSFDFNEETYQSDKKLPDTLFTSKGVNYCKGYQILTLNVFPVEYNPAKAILSYYPEIIVEIEYETTKNINQFFRNNKDDSDYVSTLVINPEITKTYNTGKRDAFNYPGGICDPADQYDYVVITRQALVDFTQTYNWSDFISKKLQDGWIATVVSVEDIDAHPDYQNVDPLFNDQQAHIREFCRDAYQDWGTQFVLIAGDHSGINGIPRRLMDTSYETSIETDIYWSNLDFTFNADSDSDWGEEGDSGFDFYSEIFIGSIPCDEPLDISNWLTKNFFYEDAYEKDYLENLGWYGGDTGWSCQGDDFIDFTFYGTDNWLGPDPDHDGPWPSWLGFLWGVDTWNATHPGMEFNNSVRWTAEPPNPGWQGGSESVAINGLKNAISNDLVTQLYGIAHASASSSLDVYDSSWESDYHNTMPFFIHDYGCHCGDMSAADDGVLHSMLFHSDIELAFACVYNTCYGWGNLDCTNSSSALQQKLFVDFMWNESKSGGTMNWQMGRVQAYTKDTMAPTIDWEHTWRAIIQGCLLFGDPAQRLKSPIQPDHEIIVDNLQIPYTVAHGETQNVQAKVMNVGKNNETNIIVNFKVDDVVLDTFTIPTLNKMEWEQVSFVWNPDFGTYLVEIEALPVVGENYTYNNHKNRTVNVIPVPDVWISPSDFTFFVDSGDTDTQLLTIGNEPGTEADLTYSLTIIGGSSWLNVNPTSGTVPIGSSTTIDFTVDATGLAEGTYIDTVKIDTNDLDESTLMIPITMYVTYANDVGVTAINNPTDIDYAGTTVVNATVFNFGSADQTNVPVKCTIYEGILEYYEDFELSDGGFTHAVGPSSGYVDDWEWGAPTYGPSSAHSGDKLWATNLGSDHSNNADGVLNSISIDLSVYPAPELRFWHWYDHTVYDCGNVKISTDGGSTWNIIYPNGGYPGTATSGNQGIPNEPAYTDISSGWEEAVFDLSAYSSDTVVLRWHFGSTSGTTHPGWYIDDIKIKSSLLPFDTGDIIYESTEYVDVDSYTGTYVEFSPIWNPTVGNYTLKVSTILPTDEDDSNNQSAMTTQMQEPPITTVDMQLYDGWNHFCIPVENNYTASTLGQEIQDCSVVSKWNAQAGYFQSFLVGISPPAADFAIENGVSYFVYTGSSSIFSVTGDTISTVSVDLYTGWNMIGWCEETSTTASDIGENINGCDVVSKWNAAYQYFNSFLIDISPPASNFGVDCGNGLFVYVDQPSTWNGLV